MVSRSLVGRRAIPRSWRAMQASSMGYGCRMELNVPKGLKERAVSRRKFRACPNEPFAHAYAAAELEIASIRTANPDSRGYFAQPGWAFPVRCVGLLIRRGFAYRGSLRLGVSA